MDIVKRLQCLFTEVHHRVHARFVFSMTPPDSSCAVRKTINALSQLYHELLITLALSIVQCAAGKYRGIRHCWSAGEHALGLCDQLPRVRAARSRSTRRLVVARFGRTLWRGPYHRYSHVARSHRRVARGGVRSCQPSRVLLEDSTPGI